MKISDRPIDYFISDKFIKSIQIVEEKEEKILCKHCMRTSSNGIRCMGICVADNDYWKIKIINKFLVCNVLVLLKWLNYLNYI